MNILKNVEVNSYLVTKGSHRLEQYLNLEGFLEKSLKIKSALKSTGKSLKSLENSLNSTIFIGLVTVYRDLSQYKIVVPLFGVQHMLHQILAQQFYANFLVLLSPLSQSSNSEVENFNT